MCTKHLLIGLLSSTMICLAQPAPAPTYDFSLSREDKIKLAESAAPAEISGKATIYVLERSGYVRVREGSNGFTCMVDRETPNTLEPECFDAEGTATTLQTRLFCEEQRAKGVSEEKINADIEEGYKNGKFFPPRKPGIVYMLSDHNHVLNPESGQIIRFVPHLMFYAPYATDADIGSPTFSMGMPFLVHPGRPDALIIVVPREASAK